MNYGQNFKHARLGAGLSVRRAAEAAGVAPSVIQKSEAGGDVRLSSIVKLAQAYGVTVDKLIGTTEEAAS